MFERYNKLKANKAVHGVIFYIMPIFLITSFSANRTKTPKIIEI
jgi:hypothetical protein